MRGKFLKLSHNAMEEEKLVLSWNNFSETSAAAFGHFGTNKEFSDVTLASGDGQQFEAHRVVLSVQCSETS